MRKKLLFVIFFIGTLFLRVVSQELFITINLDDIINSAVFSPDGKYIYTSGNDKTVKCWDVMTGSCVGKYNDGEYPIESIQLSKDGKYFLTEPAGYGWKEIWEVSPATRHKVFNKKSVHPRVMSPDGKYIVTNDNDTTIDLWETSLCKVIKSIKPPLKLYYDEVFFSSDNKYVFINTQKNNTSEFMAKTKYYSGIWDLETGSLLMKFDDDSFYISHAIFTPDGKSVLIIQYENRRADEELSLFSAEIWDIENKKVIAEWKSIKGVFVSASFNMDGKYLAINTNGCRMILETKRSLVVHDESRFFGSEQGWMFSPDGKYYMKIEAIDSEEDNMSKSNRLTLRNIVTNSVCQTIVGEKNKIRWVAFSNNSGLIATVHSDKSLKIWKSKVCP